MTTRTFKKNDVTKSYNCEGEQILATIEIGGRWVSNPSVSMLTADGWVEIITPTPEPTPEPTPTREEKIHQEIRKRYTENDEFMVLRQYTSDPTNAAYKAAFEEYNEFVESIIAKYPEEDE